MSNPRFNAQFHRSSLQMLELNTSRLVSIVPERSLEAFGTALPKVKTRLRSSGAQRSATVLCWRHSGVSAFVCLLSLFRVCLPLTQRRSSQQCSRGGQHKSERQVGRRDQARVLMPTNVSTHVLHNRSARHSGYLQRATV